MAENGTEKVDFKYNDSDEFYTSEDFENNLVNINLPYYTTNYEFIAKYIKQIEPCLEFSNISGKLDRMEATKDGKHFLKIVDGLIR